jgi:hypothetical protein
MNPDLLKSIESLLEQKRSLASREKRLIDDLNAVLPKIGYRVAPVEPNSHSARKPLAKATAHAKRLVCPHCSRRFAHPLHLGRHLSATHRKKSAA